MSTAPTPKRGEIWLVDFEPSVGAEIRKLRPAVVVSLDGLGKLPLRIVAPITDWRPSFSSLSWFVEVAANQINGLVKNSGVDTFQVKSVSLARFHRPIGALTAQQLDDVAVAITYCVGGP